MAEQLTGGDDGDQGLLVEQLQGAVTDHEEAAAGRPALELDRLAGRRQAHRDRCGDTRKLVFIEALEGLQTREEADPLGQLLLLAVYVCHDDHGVCAPPAVSCAPDRRR